MTVARPPAILDHLSALADTTRSRILLLLDRHELTVSELCGIMQLPQSTVSRHLKALADSGWISARAEGTSNVYAMTRDDLDALGAPAVGARARAGRTDAGSAARSTPRAGSACRAPHEIAGILFVVCRPVGSCARRSLRRALPSRRASRVRGRGVDGRRSRVRHGPDDGGARAVRAARHRGRCIRGHAPGGEKAPAGLRERRASPRRPRGASRSTTAGSMRRRWCSCCTICPNRSARSPKSARVLKPGGRLLDRRHAAARSRELSPADGSRVARLFG